MNLKFILIQNSHMVRYNKIIYLLSNYTYGCVCGTKPQSQISSTYVKYFSTFSPLTALGCFGVQTSPFLGTSHEEENFSENFTDDRKEILVYEELWLENNIF